MSKETLGKVQTRVAKHVNKELNKTIFGYRPEKIQVKHVEGDIWEENGKRRTIKNGINQTVTRLDGARMPLFCPSCSGAMNCRADDIMYNIHGECHICVIKRETEMRKNGTYDQYEKNMLRSREINKLKFIIEQIEDAMVDMKSPTFVQSDGTIEYWNINLEQLREDMNNDLRDFKNRLIILESEVELC